MNRTVLTIATGKDLYLQLAINLARSFFLWHTEGSINFKIVTDSVTPLPADLVNKIQLQLVQPGELGESFSSKLYLDKLANEGQTVFIDSDCLIFGNLLTVFEDFKGHDVSVIGGYISEGEWFGDIASICKKFNVPHIPKFNGGIYYIEKGHKATEVYSTARELEKRYTEIGFVKLRDKPNDELLMGLAMQLHGQTPVTDDSTIMSDPQACPGPYQIDVINGKALLINPPAPDLRHQSWYPFHEVRPLVFHFLGYYTMHYPYRREVYLLKKACSGKLSVADRVIAKLTIEYPERLKQTLKNTFRGIYRAVFGVRRIKPSQRI